MYNSFILAGNNGSGKNFAKNVYLHNPTGIVLDISGNVIFVDQFNDLLRKIDVITGLITVVAGNGNLRSTDYGDVRSRSTGYGDGGLAVLSVLTQPYGLASDASYNLYITQASGVNSIRMINATTGK